MPEGRFIAVDWGTTNRRIFVIAGGDAASSERDARGTASMDRADYPAEIAAIRARFGDLPVLLAGTVGSNIGWQTTPYVAAPAGLAAIARALVWIDTRTAIVPGLSCAEAGRVDVMRGEEVQLLGAAAAGLVPPTALTCQPGTHCKWTRLSAGEIASWTTAMTGELFALLRGNGLLARQLGGAVADGTAFRDGVAEGAKRDLAASLFGIRARGVLGLGDDDAASFASGLLIGADVAARLAAGDTVHIVSDPALGALYAVAIAQLGGRAMVADSSTAFIAGIGRIWELA